MTLKKKGAPNLKQKRRLRQVSCELDDDSDDGEETEPAEKTESDERAHGSQIELMTPAYYISVTALNLKACSKQARRLMRYYEAREARRFNNSTRLSVN